jgi:hypothetical protein
MTRDLQLAKRIRGDRFWFKYFILFASLNLIKSSL